MAPDVEGSNPSSRPKHTFSLRVLSESPTLPHTLYTGSSGWAYPTWKPGFYPAKTPAKQFLPYYGTRCNSVEVNYTFRALPTNAMVAGWVAAVPEKFRFSFKAPQTITHIRRLRDCGPLVDAFTGALAHAYAAKKLGVLLFQLPPNFKADLDRLNAFLDLPTLRDYRVAFEFRHESWFADATYDALRNHNAALCVAESEDLVTPEVHTAADFTFFRLRNPAHFTADDLPRYKAHFAELTQGRDVFAYFKHEDEPAGVLAAASLLEQAASQ